MFTITKLAFVKSRLAATVVGDNQVSDKEEHVSAANRWKGCAYFKPVQNPPVKDTCTPKTDTPIWEAHFSPREHFMLPQSTSD